MEIFCIIGGHTFCVDKTLLQFADSPLCKLDRQRYLDILAHNIRWMNHVLHRLLYQLYGACEHEYVAYRGGNGVNYLQRFGE